MAEPMRSDNAVTTGLDAQASTASGPPVVIKKYANRRLYNTEASSYVTLEHLALMVKTGRDFVVYDAKTGDDITRSVLTQIIVEEEGKGRNLLPISFLRQLISFYDDSLQSVVPRYLEYSMGVFAKQQEQMRKAMTTTMEGLFPFSVEEMSKQNLAMMDRAFSLFAPFYRGGPGGGGNAPGAPGQAAAGSQRDEMADLERLRGELEALRGQLAEAERSIGKS